jgi:beta-ketoacyl-acyl-carrier-protein synthase II
VTRGARRVAITGLGLVTPQGNDTPATWDAIIAGRSGIGPITEFDASGFPVRIAAEVKGFDAEARIEAHDLLPLTTRHHRFALAAAGEALRDAGVRPEGRDAERWGCVAGSGIMGVEFGEMARFHADFASGGRFQPERIREQGFPGRESLTFRRSQPNAGLALLVQACGIRGPAMAVHTACASGGQAVGAALRLIRRGAADRVLAGGFDSMINPVGLAGFCLLRALSTDNDRPGEASRPFDATRNGFVLGEGAGFLVLEEWEAARGRGARIYAELAGDGNSLSSYRITDSHPSGDGPIQAMEAALRDAGLEPGDIDYVNAHGTSTLMNDASECTAIRAVFGAEAERVLTSSTKSWMGHLIAAAGAVEAAVCALSIHHGVAPASANLRERDPACELRFVTGKARVDRLRAALSNSFGFGGSNNCLVFRHPDEVAARRTRGGAT